MTATSFFQVEEDQILLAIEKIEGSGESAKGYQKLISMGEVYKSWGLTPMYLIDEESDRCIIRIAETQDKSKLH